MAVRGVIVDNRVFVLGAILRRENDSEKYVYVGQVAFQIDTGSDITILSPMSLWALNIHPWEIEPARGLVTTLGGVIAPYTLSDFYLWFRDDETGLNMHYLNKVSVFVRPWEYFNSLLGNDVLKEYKISIDFSFGDVSLKKQ
jgi:hypothetical protein